MSEYRVKVKNSPGWENFDTCMVSISMGQLCHEGEKLEALLAWAVQNHRVRILNISDTLHRHNLARNGLSDQEAYQRAFALGNEWMQRNDETLKKHLPHFRHIHRWGDWLSHPDFKETERQFLKFYNECPDFKTAADSDIDGFVQRKENQGEKTDRLQKRESSFAYLMEELAAYTLIGRQYAANRVYPAKPLTTFQYLRRSPDVPESLKGMENFMCTRITLNRVRNWIPLQEAA